MPISPPPPTQNHPVLGIQLRLKAGFWKEWLTTRLPLYLLVGVLTSCISFTPDFTLARFLGNLLVSTLMTIVLWEGNGRISDALDERISWFYHPWRRVSVAILLQSVYSVGSSLLLFELVFLVWPDFLNTPVPKKAILIGTVILSLVITFLITLILTTRSFFLHWRESVIEAERLQNESLQMRIASLKNQLNPHFLFNSLNVLASLVGSENQPAQRFIEQLARIYRYVLDTSQAEVVPLAREWSFITSYLQLLKTRFGDNLSYHLDPLPDGRLGLVPMTLQVLVENAIKHNVVSSSRPLHLDIRVLPNQQLLVRNPIQPKSDIGEASGIGLGNLKEQYLHLGGDEVSFGINQNWFEVYVPLLKLQSE